MTGKFSRRALLASLTVSGLTAGCLSGSDDEPPSNSVQTAPEENNTPRDTPTQTPTPERASAEIGLSEFIMADSVTSLPDEQIPWARYEIENPTNYDHGPLQTEVRFYDADDTLLEARDGFLDYLPAETVWRDYIRYYTETPDRLDRIEVRIADEDPIVEASAIEEASLINSDMTADPEAGVDISGEVDLGDADPDLVNVIGLFYDDGDRFRGTVRNVETNPTQTVAVSAGTIGIRTPPNLENQQVTSFSVIVLDDYV